MWIRRLGTNNPFLFCFILCWGLLESNRDLGVFFFLDGAWFASIAYLAASVFFLIFFLILAGVHVSRSGRGLAYRVLVFLGFLFIMLGAQTPTFGNSGNLTLSPLHVSGALFIYSGAVAPAFARYFIVTARSGIWQARSLPAYLAVLFLGATWTYFMNQAMGGWNWDPIELIALGGTFSYLLKTHLWASCGLTPLATGAALGWARWSRFGLLESSHHLVVSSTAHPLLSLPLVEISQVGGWFTLYFIFSCLTVAVRAIRLTSKVGNHARRLAVAGDPLFLSLCGVFLLVSHTSRPGDALLHPYVLAAFCLAKLNKLPRLVVSSVHLNALGLFILLGYAIGVSGAGMVVQVSAAQAQLSAYLAWWGWGFFGTVLALTRCRQYRGPKTSLTKPMIPR